MAAIAFYFLHNLILEISPALLEFIPYYVVERSMEILIKFKKPLNGSKALILGASYKKDIDGMRESPSLKLIEIFRERGTEVNYSDSYALKLPKTRRYNYELESAELNSETVSKYDLIILSTDHTDFDYKMIAENAKLIIDTRNAFEKNEISSDKIYKA